jgi:hypothetical protein
MSYITAPGLTSGVQFGALFYDAAPALDPLLVKLQELANLPAGWRFGKGAPPTAKAIAMARDIYHMTAVLRVKADVFPGSDGSLALVFYSGETCLELCISPIGQVDLGVEEGIGFNFRETKDIPDASIGEILKELVFITEQRQDKWNFSGSSTIENSIRLLDAFGVPVSQNQETGAVSHSLTSSAPSNIPHLQESVST